jgi:hypothetical protein
MAGGLALLSLAAGASGIEIKSGNASMNMLTNEFSIAQNGDLFLYTDAGAPDQGYKYCWYYRLPNNNQNRCFSNFDTPTRSGGVFSATPDQCTLTWPNAGVGPIPSERFNAIINMKIEDGASPNQLRVTATCKFKSLAVATITYQVFNLIDLDLKGGAPNPGPDDSVVVNTLTSTAMQTEASSSDFAEIAAITPTRWEIGPSSSMRAKLNGGSADLNNSAAPYTGDGAVGFQWSLTLAPGEERTLTTAVAINMTAFPPPACPCSADFDNSGGTPDAGDIDVFFAAWLSGEATADADCSGGTPDAGDIDTFFAQWLAGGC